MRMRESVLFYVRVFVCHNAGSLSFICQPIGSALSGWLTDPIGRKRALFVVNFPHIIAWALLYFSTTMTEVYVASVLLGLGTGLTEAPIITYIGEIW